MTIKKNWGGGGFGVDIATKGATKFHKVSQSSKMWYQ